MFKLAEKYKLLNKDMERDGYGDMDHESFDTEHIYIKGGHLIPEHLAKMAGQIHTRICKSLQETFEKDKESKHLTVKEYFDLLAPKELDKLTVRFTSINISSVRRQNVENLKRLLLSFCKVSQQIRS